MSAPPSLGSLPPQMVSSDENCETTAADDRAQSPAVPRVLPLDQPPTTAPVPAAAPPARSGPRRQRPRPLDTRDDLPPDEGEAREHSAEHSTATAATTAPAPQTPRTSRFSVSTLPVTAGSTGSLSPLPILADEPAEQPHHPSSPLARTPPSPHAVHGGVARVAQGDAHTRVASPLSHEYHPPLSPVPRQPGAAASPDAVSSPLPQHYAPAISDVDDRWDEHDGDAGPDEGRDARQSASSLQAEHDLTSHHSRHVRRLLSLYFPLAVTEGDEASVSSLASDDGGDRSHLSDTSIAAIAAASSAEDIRGLAGAGGITGAEPYIPAEHGFSRHASSGAPIPISASDDGRADVDDLPFRRHGSTSSSHRDSTRRFRRNSSSRRSRLGSGSGADAGSRSAPGDLAASDDQRLSEGGAGVDAEGSSGFARAASGSLKRPLSSPRLSRRHKTLAPPSMPLSATESESDDIQAAANNPMIGGSGKYRYDQTVYGSYRRELAAQAANNARHLSVEFGSPQRRSFASASSAKPGWFRRTFLDDQGGTRKRSQRINSLHSFNSLSHKPKASTADPAVINWYNA